jgi:ankyrin repeat protein
MNKKKISLIMLSATFLWQHAYTMEQDQSTGLLEQLIEAAGINARYKEGRTALHYCAAQHSWLEKVKWLIEKGADINARDDKGFTALHYAARWGDIRIIELLVEKGADINAQAGKKGYTALQSAIKAANPVPITQRYVVEWLLKYGANPNLRNANAEPALHLATGFSQNTKDIIALLLMKGADINIHGRDSKTALHYSACEPYNRLEKIQYLIENGADIHAIDIYGNTALHIAAHEGHLETVKYLINNGADVNVHNVHGRTPYNFARHRNNIREFLEQLPDLVRTNDRDDTVYTPAAIVEKM